MPELPKTLHLAIQEEACQRRRAERAHLIVRRPGAGRSPGDTDPRLRAVCGPPRSARHASSLMDHRVDPPLIPHPPENVYSWPFLTEDVLTSVLMDPDTAIDALRAERPDVAIVWTRADRGVRPGAWSVAYREDRGARGGPGRPMAPRAVWNGSASARRGLAHNSDYPGYQGSGLLRTAGLCSRARRDGPHAVRSRPKPRRVLRASRAAPTK